MSRPVGSLQPRALLGLSLFPERTCHLYLNHHPHSRLLCACLPTQAPSPSSGLLDSWKAQESPGRQSRPRAALPHPLQAGGERASRAPGPPWQAASCSRRPSGPSESCSCTDQSLLNPYLWFYFPQFQLPILHHVPKISDKKSRINNS